MNRGRERRAAIVVDLGFGDGGKGLVTDYLVRQLGAHLVVRFNGGAQAGHNVVTPDGRHHTFSQFGAGAFSPGVHTHLSRHVVVHPTALLVEAERLARAGVADALERLSVSARALVVAPFHQAAGRLRELARGAAAHGTCGVGIGEVVQDALAVGGEALRMGDLFCGQTLAARLRRLQERKRAELDTAIRALGSHPRADAERRVLEKAPVVDAWIAAIQPLLAQGVIVDDRELRSRLSGSSAVVFEGAQGVLLDEWRGFHPHTTWSTCTFEPAVSLLSEHGYDGDVTRLGVLRTYAHRHGAGPLPTEDASLSRVLPERHNDSSGWQGPFRVGWPDLMLARYSLEVCGGVDALALTHLDALARIREWRICRSYRLSSSPAAGFADARRCFEFVPGDPSRGVRLLPGAARDLDHQALLTRALASVEPVYEPHSGPEEEFASLLEEALQVPVGLTSDGPAAQHVRLRGRALSVGTRAAHA